MIDPNRLQAVETFFYDNFTQRGELGAALSIWKEGQEIVSLAHGWADRSGTRPWQRETPVLVWSATKALAAACLVHALEQQGESLDLPMRELWPEFATRERERLTVGQLLSHQAGAAALSEPPPVLDYDAVIRALEEEPPNWPLGEGHGYHPRTFGFLLDETLRRLEGTPLADYWQRWFATPLGLDFWIGIPPEIEPLVAQVVPPKVGRDATALPEDDRRFQAAMGDRATLTARAFASPRGAHSISEMNSPELRAASLPGFGGIGTASALGKFYAMLSNGGELEGLRLFRSIEPFLRPLTAGPDRVLLKPTVFAAGVMHDPIENGQKLRTIFGPSHRAFGQPGAGGCHAFADPEQNIAFAYVLNQMTPGVFPGEKTLGLVRALYGL